MRTTTDDEAEQMKTFVRTLVEQADKSGAILADSASPEKRIRELVDNADVAFAVWEDSNKPHGVGFILLKGARLHFEALAHGGDGSVVSTMAAIPCTDIESAFIMKAWFGKPDRDA